MASSLEVVGIPSGSPARKAKIRAGRRAARPSLSIVPDAADAAKSAGLRYVSMSTPPPDILAFATAKAFATLPRTARRCATRPTLARIRVRSRIPPAWTDVWICPSPAGHIQATGRDARGRKQYRYHARWREVRDETKYDRLLAFGRALPRIRRRVDARSARRRGCRARRCSPRSCACSRRR